MSIISTPRSTVALRGPGRLDVGDADHRARTAAGDLVGLDGQLEQPLHLGRDAGGVTRQSRAEVDDPRHRGPLQRQQPARLRLGGDHAGQPGVRRAVAGQVVVEVGHHAKQAGEIRVVAAQQLVQLALAEQDHLDGQRDRLGFEPRWRRRAVLLGDRFDLDAAPVQRALEAGPRERLAQQLARVDQQVAPVGAVQRTRADQPEVGDQRAELRAVVDAPDQVGVGRELHLDDRGRVFAAAGGQQVDLVARQVGRRRERIGGCVLGGPQEVVGVLEHVGVDRREPFVDPVGLRPLGADIVEHVADGELGRIVVQLAHALDLLLAQPHSFAHHALQALLQRLDALAQPLLVGLGQLAEVVRAHHVVVLDRCQREAVGGANQHDAVAHRLVVERRQCLGLALGHLGLDPLDLGTVVVGLERRRNRGLELVDQPSHVLAKLRAAPLRQSERDRPVRFGEVVQVDPVGVLAALGVAGDRAAHEPGLADAGRAHHEQVVALEFDTDRVRDRLQRSRVADQRGRPGRLGRGLERDVGRVAAARESIGRQGRHRRSPDRSRATRAGCWRP